MVEPLGDGYTSSESKLPDAPTPDDIFPDNEVLRDAAWAGFYAVCNDRRLCELHRVNALIKLQAGLCEGANARRQAKWDIACARDCLNHTLSELEKKANDGDGRG